MKKTVIFILLVSISLLGFPQSKRKKEIHPLSELEVVNSNLLPVLDTIIKMKNESVSFESATLFAVEFDWDSIKTDLIAIRALGFRLYDNDPDILGYFDRGRYTFIVKGDSIRTSIFQKSENYSSLPITLSFSHQVGEILHYLPNDIEPPNRYFYYM